MPVTQKRRDKFCLNSEVPASAVAPRGLEQGVTDAPHSRPFPAPSSLLRLLCARPSRSSGVDGRSRAPSPVTRPLSVEPRVFTGSCDLLAQDSTAQRGPRRGLGPGH